MKHLAVCSLIAMTMFSNRGADAQGFRFHADGESVNTWNPARTQKKRSLKPWFASISTRIGQQANFPQMVYKLKGHLVLVSARVTGNRLTEIRIKDGTGVKETDRDLQKLIEKIFVNQPPNELPFQEGISICIDARDQNAESPRIQVYLAP